MTHEEIEIEEREEARAELRRAHPRRDLETGFIEDDCWGVEPEDEEPEELGDGDE